MSRTPRKRLHCGQCTSSLPVSGTPSMTNCLSQRGHSKTSGIMLGPEFTLGKAKEKRKLDAPTMAPTLLRARASAAVSLYPSRTRTPEAQARRKDGMPGRSTRIAAFLVVVAYLLTGPIRLQGKQGLELQ